MERPMDPTELRGIPLFDSLTDDQLAWLAGEGEVRTFREGEEL